MERIKSLIKGFYVGKNFKRQLPPMLLGVFMMGFSLSWLNLIDWGTDTYTNMNLAISSKIGLSIGNWQLIINIVLLIVVLILGADNFGFGTIANMVFIGYLLEFFTWVWTKVLPENVRELLAAQIDIEWFKNPPENATKIFLIKLAVMLVALTVFIFSAALYMDSGLGVSPCDAIAFIVKKRLPKAPVKLIRIVYDVLLIGIALLFGSKLYPVTILMAFTLGPVIEFVGNNIQRWFKFDE